ncbi:MAG: HipA family kinase [Campylobacterota bacterium]|nr:HipA family kinase [Campylobacterota bacterium]
MEFDKLKVLRVSSILGELKSGGVGSTLPLHIRASDNKEYVLKTRYNTNTIHKDLSIFSELLAHSLDKYFEFNLSPQKLVLLYVDETTQKIVEEAIEQEIITEDIEVLENIKNSFGFNLGIEYIKNVDRVETTDMNKTFVKNIIHLDNYVINNDREESNPNILKSLSNQKDFYAIDFDNAFNTHLVMEDIIANDLLKLQKAKECNITNDSKYLFSEQSKNIKQGQKLSISEDEVLNIIDTIFPEEWENILKYKESISEIISARIGNKTIFKREHNGC